MSKRLRKNADSNARISRSVAALLVGTMFTALLAGFFIFSTGQLHAPSIEDSDADTALETGNDWELLPERASVPRTEVFGVLFNDEIYVIGGYRQDGKTDGTVEIFNPVTSSWRTAPSVPSAVHHAHAVVYENNLYVIGGLVGGDSQPSDQVWRFDGERWRTGPRLPYSVGAGATAVVGDKLYLVGGTTNEGSTNRLLIFDFPSQTWSGGAPMKVKRNHIALGVIGQHLHVLGGRDDEGASDLTIHERYNIMAGSWDDRAPMPTGRSGHAAIVFESRLHVVGGEVFDDGDSRTFTEHEIYNPTNNTWYSGKPLPEGRHGLGLAIYDDALYALLGGPSAGLSVSGTVYRLLLNGN